MKLRTISIILAAAVSFACSRVPETKNSTNTIPAAAVTPDHKGVRDSKIQAEADRITPLFGSMPKVAVFVVDEPIQPKNIAVEPGVAYTTCSPGKVPTVYVKKAFLTKAPNQQITNILKHELTHAWFCAQGIQTGHDARFRAKLKEIGGFGN